MSVYLALGGSEAVNATLDAFYVRVLADPRVSKYFEGVDMTSLKSHAEAFFAMAFGGPSEYHGHDLRTAHERPRSMGLEDQATDVFLGHFRKALEESGVHRETVAAVMEILDEARGDVLAH